MSAQTYDDVCAKGKEEAEQRLIDHLQEFGGEVWNIKSGCMGCKTNANNVALKTCSKCKTALFCGKECQKKAWNMHKYECMIMSTMQEMAVPMPEAPAVYDLVRSCLETLTWSPNAKEITDESLLAVAKSIGLTGPVLPGWFTSINLVQHPASQTAYVKAIIVLFALLRDDECWTRDSDSFPRSSYTYATTIPKTASARATALAHFLELQGPLVLFTAWMQDPQPPAIQSVPFEKRLIHGLMDTLLQIEEIRSAIDAFMDARDAAH
ncbi:hypothetical protein SDRG_05556 [Saprolegnia diclina VS20]|uniref:MYND-type domain-containing protein n=1 Tax=Saprolegnia diclina (strain VS20) TaxID=1156394 RepID=T0RXG5_SAPDV|nr:hypothetical protein SDRG_05556 [Saprolegnia diclina VS20]EQC37338.1 hypothetical protein SDRG_05556 [Saprolegnia diclina VS20]|eukprot:XP_008609500.1 hypothetical protein SDRG_05556 [Saprolegnia diclina VS20]